MQSRRLLVCLSAGILAFQGFTLAFDLLNCTALTWAQLHRSGLLEQASELPASCNRPNGRIDEAVNHGLSVLSGLALGSSVKGQGLGAAPSTQVDLNTLKTPQR
ncbi:hypothetical protein [Synechococcus sp. W4D4]|uniref:hypothetical protein n=1 Tax=Synechococcus sp. W4D4 TaxID=3392294 RepID=UPI0039E7D95E